MIARIPAFGRGRAADPAHRPDPGAGVCGCRSGGRRHDHRHRRGRPMARPPRGYRGAAQGTDPVGRFRDRHLVHRAARVLPVAAAAGVRGRPADASHLQRRAAVAGRARRRRPAADGLRPRCHQHGDGVHDRAGGRSGRGHQRPLRPRPDGRRRRHLPGGAVPDVVQPAHPQCCRSAAAPPPE